MTTREGGHVARPINDKLMVKNNEHRGLVWLSSEDHRHHWCCCNSSGANHVLNISLIEMKNHQQTPTTTG